MHSPSISCKNIPVLLYHRIADHWAGDDAKITVLPETFEAHLRYLHRKGYRIRSLDDAELAGQPRAREIVITFDDGYLDNYATAFPLLQKYGFTATFFLTTELIGKHHRWGDSTEFPYMSWQHAREMLAHGFSFGSHTCTHPDLTTVGKKALFHEIHGSRKRLEDQLGVQITHFSYPFGKYDEATKRCVEEAEYVSACSVSNYDGDRYSIERFMLSLDDGDLRFRIKASPWGSYIRKLYKKLGLSHEQ